jgi:hypothetical protein
MNIEEFDFRKAGESLINHAKYAEFSPRGKVSGLFPYIWEASRRLSTRAISRFLSEELGIKLSAVSVAKALRNPEKYWEEFAEFIEPFARLVCDAHNVDLEDVLYNHDLFGYLRGQPPTVAESEFREYEAAYEVIKTRWFSLSEGVRDSCFSYLVPKAGSASEGEETQETEEAEKTTDSVEGNKPADHHE